MWCPKCNEAFLEMIDRTIDYDDGQTLSGVEYYHCPLCDGTFQREVTYTIEREGNLISSEG